MGILTNFLKLLKPEPNDFVDVVKHISENYDKLDRNAETLDKQDKGVLGGYNGIFPLTVASKNGIYLLPATNKFYVCVENYSGSSLTSPNANFEELSVFQNRNKLENLIRIKQIGIPSYTKKDTVFSIQSEIPNYYKVALCLCSSRINTDNIELVDDFKNTNTEISYSFTTTGLFKVSLVNDENLGRSRVVDIIAILKKL